MYCSESLHIATQKVCKRCNTEHSFSYNVHVYKLRYNLYK